ncbi:amine dehydrogenase large subunit [Sphingobium nicotianae]|uniref:Methylamine dehydrogenase n=1 Tax=Sphingobium nicotianae TaxID=2782607 RepID=A0A9X1DC07_9SPHN|nr:amine dehydrogenase large subunit [Sphingobium nicotianae]MBT2187285.1 methylamine dehydrogenase [Sphingobium nicotianae]
MTLAAARVLSSLTILALMTASSAVRAQEGETSEVSKMEPPKPEWVFVRGGFGSEGTSIYDTKTGKMKGMVNTSASSDMALDPTGKFYYVSETIWTKGNRGTRQDMVAVYDAIDLKLQADINIPDRLLVGERKQNFIISDDGKWGFVYNMSPASSVNVVDLTKRKFVKAIELPGCAALMPNPAVGFSALCSDGSLATVTVGGAKPVITHSAPFFSATGDPIFENFQYDKAKQQTVMMSYTGLIYTATLGATPTVAQPYSIQAAAGYAAADTKPLAVDWYPGGRQPMALHRPSGELYVLMHMGEYWSHKAAGEEIWVLDTTSRKVVRRFPLKIPAAHIEVTQGAEPMIFLNEEEGGNGIILDGKTGKEEHKIERAGGGMAYTMPAS